MFLTSPYIDQALSQACAFCSLDRGKESANSCYGVRARLRQDDAFGSADARYGCLMVRSKSPPSRTRREKGGAPGFAETRESSQPRATAGAGWTITFHV